MTEQRKKLIELICKAKNEYYSGMTNAMLSNFIADYLLANGVVVLPCKVGDTVYRIMSPQHANPFIWDYKIDAIGASYTNSLAKRAVIKFEEFDKTAFLTREKAEAALKKMEEVSK